MQRIIYENDEGEVVILIPASECLQEHTIEEIAIKDVPYNKPFWIIPASEIPTDRTDRNAWVLDKESLGEADGVGGKSNVFN